MLRSNPHALYSQLASPYASHLYAGLMPGAPPNLSSIHERMKLEEEHRARIAREEEKARIAREEEKAREREREIREKEMREREQREKEMREREQREKEMREREMRELREKEMREREQREKEMREREMRDKEMREREKLMQQHHFMQSQRNNPYMFGLLPQMVGLRPPHPGYPMHPSLLGLTLPSQIPTSLPSSLNLQHHSQPHSGSSSIPITSSPSMSQNMSLMPPIGSNVTFPGMNHAAHGLPHGLSMFSGNLPPPAHLYSPLAPPSASPSGLSNSSYNHPMMNPRSSPQPLARRSPSSNSNHQSLNLSKNPMSSTSPYTSKGLENRNLPESRSNASTTQSPTSVATISVPSMMNDKNFKIEIPNISNGNNVNKEQNSGSHKNEVKDLSAVKSEPPREEKLSPSDDLKPIVADKQSAEPAKISDNDIMRLEEKVDGGGKEEVKSKADAQPQEFTTPKVIDQKEIKVEAEDKPLSSNDNKTIESEKSSEELGAKENVTDAQKDEDRKIEDKPSIIDDTNIDEITASTKNSDASKTSSKK
jgi:hypothetical protein